MTNARPSITSVSATQRKGRTQRPPKSKGQLNYASLSACWPPVSTTPKKKNPEKPKRGQRRSNAPATWPCCSRNEESSIMPALHKRSPRKPPHWYSSILPPPQRHSRILPLPPSLPQEPQSLSTPGPGQTEGQSCEAGTGPRCGGHDEQCSRASSRSDRAGRHG